ncbi:MAG: hypothetical protein N3B10_06730 [Armatimonadetes bacterium]|nr:hypothetical protein [Armatimonadota bacterium]
MAKRKSSVLTVDQFELLKAREEVARMFGAQSSGQISEEEFKQWWETRVAFRGRFILKKLLKQREMARGWDTKTKSSS